MESCNKYITSMKQQIINSNQQIWFIRLKQHYGGYLHNIDNPKLQSLKNILNMDISDTLFALCCYIVEFELLNDDKDNDIIIDINNKIFG
jgi:hypothetical protein